MTGAWCPSCRQAWAANGTDCEDCRRRRNWGVVLTAIAERMPLAPLGGGQGVGPTAETGAVLAAVAALMQERQALLHRHRRELRDEQREAQRGARDAYDQGRDDGRRDGRD